MVSHHIRHSVVVGLLHLPTSLLSISGSIIFVILLYDYSIMLHLRTLVVRPNGIELLSVGPLGN
jgi:hypothetical protein